jgi:hypothetical protein
MDFNAKDGQRFSVVDGYLLPALERRNLTLLTGTRVNGDARRSRHQYPELRQCHYRHGGDRGFDLLGAK